MLIGDILRRARRAADDTVQPYYTGDPDMLSYMSQAEKDLARAGRLLREVRTWTTEADEKWIAERGDDGLSAEIVEVVAAKILVGTQWLPLGIHGRGTKNEVHGVVNDYNLVYTSAETTSTHRPSSLLLGRRTGYIQLVPTPDDAYTIEVDLFVLPTNELTAARTYLPPEVPDEWHYALEHGTAFYAMSNSSSEQYDPSRFQTVTGLWERAKADARAGSRQQAMDAGEVGFHGNGLW